MKSHKTIETETHGHAHTWHTSKVHTGPVMTGPFYLSLKRTRQSAAHQPTVQGVPSRVKDTATRCCCSNLPLDDGDVSNLGDGLGLSHHDGQLDRNGPSLEEYLLFHNKPKLGVVSVVGQGARLKVHRPILSISLRQPATLASWPQHSGGGGGQERTLAIMVCKSLRA